MEDRERSELSRNTKMPMGNIHAYIIVYIKHSQVLARVKGTDSGPPVVTY